MDPSFQHHSLLLALPSRYKAAYPSPTLVVLYQRQGVTPVYTMLSLCNDATAGTGKGAVNVYGMCHVLWCE